MLNTKDANAQNDRPTRPQAQQPPERTLWGTLRMAASREQSWRSFSAFVLNGAEDREQIAQRNRLVLQDCPRRFNIVRHGALPARLQAG